MRNIKEKLRKIKVIERIYKISLREVLGREGRKIREEEILWNIFRIVKDKSY